MTTPRFRNAQQALTIGAAGTVTSAWEKPSSVEKRETLRWSERLANRAEIGFSHSRLAEPSRLDLLRDRIAT